MLSAQIIDPQAPLQVVPSGEPILRRGVQSASVYYVESGRLTLGLLDGDAMEHQLGLAVGPCWLDPAAAVLGLLPAIDVVAETQVEMRQVPIETFRDVIAKMPDSAQRVLQDIAKAHRQQTELAVSRLAKDAEARCAEWLVRHAQVSEQGALAVSLQQRKRVIAAQLGIAPETFSRVLRQLRDRSMISGSGRSIDLIDPTGLRSLAGL